MDWSRSGIRNRYEYEAIDPIDLDCSLGLIDGIVGGTITESYASDYRSSCSLDCDGADIPLGCLIRVWHIAELDGETVREELGTFMQDTSSQNLIYGRYTGTMDMYSTMIRLGTDLRGNDMSVAKNTDVVSHFENRVRNSFGTPYVTEDIVSKNKKFPKAHTWEAGTSVLSECQLCADAVGGFIHPDAHGRIVLEPYFNPKDRAASFTIADGPGSVILPGVDVERPPIVNRVVMTYDYSTSGGSTKRLAQYAQVDASHPWHPTKIGRWITEEAQGDELDVDDGDSQATVKAAMKKIVDRRLREIVQSTSMYSAETLYLPVSAGQVGMFEYEGIRAKVLLSEREIALDAKSLMNVTLEAIEEYDPVEREDPEE